MSDLVSRSALPRGLRDTLSLRSNEVKMPHLAKLSFFERWTRAALAPLVAQGSEWNGQPFLFGRATELPDLKPGPLLRLPLGTSFARRSSRFSRSSSCSRLRSSLVRPGRAPASTLSPHHPLAQGLRRHAIQARTPQ
jgi:hypothetical protein